MGFFSTRGTPNRRQNTEDIDQVLILRGNTKVNALAETGRVSNKIVTAKNILPAVRRVSEELGRELTSAISALEDCVAEQNHVINAPELEQQVSFLLDQFGSPRIFRVNMLSGHQIAQEVEALVDDYVQRVREVQEDSFERVTNASQWIDESNKALNSDMNQLPVAVELSVADLSSDVNQQSVYLLNSARPNNS